MNDRKRFLFICVCLILICISLGIRFYIDYAEDHYRDLYIDFIEPDQSYEIGSMLDAISFIDKTNAVNSIIFILQKMLWGIRKNLF